MSEMNLNNEPQLGGEPGLDAYGELHDEGTHERHSSTVAAQTNPRSTYTVTRESSGTDNVGQDYYQVVGPRVSATATPAPFFVEANESAQIKLQNAPSRVRSGPFIQDKDDVENSVPVESSFVVPPYGSAKVGGQSSLAPMGKQLSARSAVGAGARSTAGIAAGSLSARGHVFVRPSAAIGASSAMPPPSGTFGSSSVVGSARGGAGYAGSLSARGRAPSIAHGPSPFYGPTGPQLGAASVAAVMSAHRTARHALFREGLAQDAVLSGEALPPGQWIGGVHGEAEQSGENDATVGLYGGRVPVTVVPSPFPAAPADAGMPDTGAEPEEAVPAGQAPVADAHHPGTDQGVGSGQEGAESMEDTAFTTQDRADADANRAGGGDSSALPYSAGINLLPMSMSLSGQESGKDSAASSHNSGTSGAQSGVSHVSQASRKSKTYSRVEQLQSQAGAAGAGAGETAAGTASALPVYALDMDSGIDVGMVDTRVELKEFQAEQAESPTAVMAPPTSTSAADDDDAQARLVMPSDHDERPLYAEGIQPPQAPVASPAITPTAIATLEHEKWQADGAAEPVPTDTGEALPMCGIGVELPLGQEGKEVRHAEILQALDAMVAEIKAEQEVTAQFTPPDAAVPSAPVPAPSIPMPIAEPATEPVAEDMQEEAAHVEVVHPVPTPPLAQPEPEGLSVCAVPAEAEVAVAREAEGGVTGTPASVQRGEAVVTSTSQGSSSAGSLSQDRPAIHGHATAKVRAPFLPPGKVNTTGQAQEAVMVAMSTMVTPAQIPKTSASLAWSTVVKPGMSSDLYDLPASQHEHEGGCSPGTCTAGEQVLNGQHQPGVPALTAEKRAALLAQNKKRSFSALKVHQLSGPDAHVAHAAGTPPVKRILLASSDEPENAWHGREGQATEEMEQVKPSAPIPASKPKQAKPLVPRPAAPVVSTSTRSLVAANKGAGTGLIADDLDGAAVAVPQSSSEEDIIMDTGSSAGAAAEQLALAAAAARAAASAARKPAKSFALQPKAPIQPSVTDKAGKSKTALVATVSSAPVFDDLDGTAAPPHSVGTGTGTGEETEAQEEEGAGTTMTARAMAKAAASLPKPAAKKGLKVGPTAAAQPAAGPTGVLKGKSGTGNVTATAAAAKKAPAKSAAAAAVGKAAAPAKAAAPPPAAAAAMDEESDDALGSDSEDE